MALETIKLEKFYNAIPFCASWIGKRRSGKSLSAAMVIQYLVKRKAFDRIIVFMGTEYCNPELVSIIERKYDRRLIFHAFNEDVLLKIIEQQKILRDQNKNSNCLIVWDDIFTSNNRYSHVMNKLFSSGRHWLISCITLCVSWVDIAPSLRRALDFCVLFSNITYNDTHFLIHNYLNRELIEKAKWSLKTNKQYCGLVIQTSGKQELFLMKFKKKKLVNIHVDSNKECYSKNKCLETPDIEQSLGGQVANKIVVSI